MCNAVAASCRFDRSICPLLMGLPEDEQERRIREDPRIAACIAAVEGRGSVTQQHRALPTSTHCDHRASPKRWTADDAAA